MIQGATPVQRNVLIVDDGLARPETAAGRATENLAKALEARAVNVIRALSLDDGQADRRLQCPARRRAAQLESRRRHCRQRIPRPSHCCIGCASATEKVPVFLLADREGAKRSITIEVGGDGRRVRLAARGHAPTSWPAASWRRSARYRATDPAALRARAGQLFAAARALVVGAGPPGRHRLSRSCPRVAPSSTSSARTSSARTWASSAAQLGSLLDHTGPVAESERYAARVFGAHR